MESKDLEKITMSRRCTSEPPLPGNRPSSTFTQRTAFSSASVKDVNASQSPRQKLNLSFSSGRPVVRSSTFPLLPSIHHTSKPQQLGLKPISNNLQPEKFPSFKNNAFHNREKILSPHQRGIEGRKFQLRSRYIETGITIKEPTPPKNPAPLRCNPLRKRVQEIGDCEEKETDIKNDEDEDEISGLHLNVCQSNLRRLSVITEKSAFSKTSKTLLFDLEEDNGLNKSTLPAVGKEFRRKRTDENNNCCEKNSTKLQEHLQITGKQFNPLETKAALLSNWFQTLQTG